MGSPFNKCSMRESHPTIFLCVALFLPTVNYALYFTAVFFVLLYALSLRPLSRLNIQAFLLFGAYILFLALPKIFYSFSISDVKELGKILLMLAIIFLSSMCIDSARVKLIIAIAVGFDLTFSFLQWMSVDSPIFLYLQSLMHPTHHIEGSLTLASVRALGIFSDPAEHAAVIMICYLYFLSLLRNRKWPLQSFFGSLLCAIILIITQSKTGLIAFLATIPIAVYCFSQSFSKMKMLLLALISTVASFYYLPEDLFLRFEQIYFLVEYGMEVSSFAERQIIWNQLFAASFLDAPPQLALFGVGRGYLELLGYQSSVFDNDVLYILNAYGLLGLLMAVLVYLYAIVKVAKAKTSIESTWLFFLLLVSPIMGFATDFISSLKVMVLFGLVINIYLMKIVEERDHGVETQGQCGPR